MDITIEINLAKKKDGLLISFAPDLNYFILSVWAVQDRPCFKYLYTELKIK